MGNRELGIENGEWGIVGRDEQGVGGKSRDWQDLVLGGLPDFLIP